MTTPPATEDELRQRLRALSGRTLGHVAGLVGVDVPADFRRAKGWVGQLLEKALGATAASRSEPDFPQLGVELKSVPVDLAGRPMESTFVATLDLATLDLRWETSPVRHKLARIAWVPVVADKSIPVAERRIGTGLVWSPSADEEALLRADYEHIVELVEAGFGERLTGHTGVVLQLRPKGANAAALRWAVNEEGAKVKTAPRAFYLRPAFTEALFRRHFQMPAR